MNLEHRTGLLRLELNLAARYETLVSSLATGHWLDGLAACCVLGTDPDANDVAYVMMTNSNIRLNLVKLPSPFSTLALLHSTHPRPPPSEWTTISATVIWICKVGCRVSPVQLISLWISDNPMCH